MKLATTNRKPTLVILIALFTVACVGCGSATAAEDSGASISAAGSTPQLIDVWTRPTAPGATSTAFYATIRTEADIEDQVLGATSNICDMVELHVTHMTDGVMSMSPAEPNELTVTKQQDLILEPGGLHIMCMGLTEPVEEGDQVQLSVEFENGGTVTAEAIVESR